MCSDSSTVVMPNPSSPRGAGLAFLVGCVSSAMGSATRAWYKIGCHSTNTKNGIRRMIWRFQAGEAGAPGTLGVVSGDPQQSYLSSRAAIMMTMTDPML